MPPGVSGLIDEESLIYLASGWKNLSGFEGSPASFTPSRVPKARGESLSVLRVDLLRWVSLGVAANGKMIL